MTVRKTKPKPAFSPPNAAGSAAIEFGLFVPFFLALLLGTAEVGFGIYEAMQVYNGAHAGMIYAAKNGWDEAGISGAVVSASGVKGLTATPAPVQFCGCPGSGGLEIVGCDATCGDGNPPGSYIEVSAALPHQTMLPGASFGLPSTLTAKAILRLN